MSHEPVERRLAGSHLSTRVFQTLVDVKVGELRALLLAFAFFFCLLSCYYIIRPVREEMGALVGRENLAWLFNFTFFGMLAAVPLFGVAVSRLTRRWFVPLVNQFFVLNIALFAGLLHTGVAPIAVAKVFFVWTSVFNLFVISVFWSVMADVFTSRQGKRLYGFIAAGGTLGQLVSSWFTNAFTETIGIAWLLLISLGLLQLAVFIAILFMRTSRAVSVAEAESSRTGSAADGEAESRTDSAADGEAESRTGSAADGDSESVIGGGLLAGITRIVRSPYLLGICGYIILMTVCATFLYFQQADVVRGAFADREVRTEFFAFINLLTGLITVLLQIVVTGRLLARFPLAAMLAMLPLIVGLGFFGLGLWPTLAVLVAFQVIRRSANFSLARPSREILFNVVSREDKYKAKNVIDTVVYRGGDVVGGWAYNGLVMLGLGLAATAFAVIPMAALWLITGVLLGRKQAAMARST